MNHLYIANLVRKKKISDGMIICYSVGPIVGVLIGTHFLSSRNKVYLPMIRKKVSFDELTYLRDFSLEKEEFLSSSFEYAYYELKEIEDYSLLEEEIVKYRENFHSVNYFICLEGTTPYIIRYKE